MSEKPIVGLGTPTLDRVIAVPETPRFDAGIEVRGLGEFGGGPVATALVAVSRLGWSASLLAAVGDDPAGQVIVDGLAADGVDVAAVRSIPGRRSAVSTILVSPDAARAILYDPGDAPDPEIGREETALIRGAAGLMLDRCSEASLAAAEIAREAGIPVLLDAGGWDPRIMELAARSTIVIASAYHAEARGLAPEAACAELLAAGASVAIVTLGAAGAVGRSATERHTEPAYPVVAVDTTGAGDVYHGAFFVAYLEGKPSVEAMRFAAVVAGLKCQMPGGRAGIPTRAEVDALLMR